MEIYGLEQIWRVNVVDIRQTREQIKGGKGTDSKLQPKSNRPFFNAQLVQTVTGLEMPRAVVDRRMEAINSLDIQVKTELDTPEVTDAIVKLAVTAIESLGRILGEYSCTPEVDKAVLDRLLEITSDKYLFSTDICSGEINAGTILNGIVDKTEMFIEVDSVKFEYIIGKDGQMYVMNAAKNLDIYKRYPLDARNAAKEAAQKIAERIEREKDETARFIGLGPNWRDPRS